MTASRAPRNSTSLVKNASAASTEAYPALRFETISERTADFESATSTVYAASGVMPETTNALSKASADEALTA